MWSFIILDDVYKINYESIESFIMESKFSSENIVLLYLIIFFRLWNIKYEKKTYYTLKMIR